MAKKLTNKEKRVRNMAKRIERDMGTRTAKRQVQTHMRLHGVSLSTANRDWDAAFSSLWSTARRAGKDTATLPTVEDLCETFRAVITDWFPESIRREIDATNAEYKKDPNLSKCCATHNHCDANQAMVDAWEALSKVEIDGACEAQAIIWGAAWDMAKTRGFGVYDSKATA